jgi:formylglycine-generating enzyme required for sulfatase activity
MKVLFVTALALTLGLSSALQGQVTEKGTGPCGVSPNETSVTWTVIDSLSPTADHHYTLIIDGTGNMADYKSLHDVPWWDYILKIKYVRIGENITGIDCFIFKGPAFAEVFTYNATPPTWECNESFYPVDMVRVKGGSYRMGGVTAGFTTELTNAHEVELDDFYIGKIEVTQRQWYDVMGGTVPSVANSDKPMGYVSWEMIVGTKDTGVDVAYTINGVEYFTNGFCAKKYLLTGIKWRLPTEAEWEYAARGGTNNNNYDYAGGNIPNNVAWHSGNASNSTHTVGTKTANTLGLYDMSGNVWEWCSDWYDTGGILGYSTAVAAQTKNPVGAMMGSDRVNRGGSWYSTEFARMQVLSRHYSPPTTGNSDNGFRLACSLPE